MKKAAFKISVIFLSLCLLSACAHGSLKDLSVFVRLFTLQELSPEAFFTEKDEDENIIYFTFLQKGESRIMLSLICSEDNIINEVRIFLPRLDKNAKEKEITTEDISLFSSAVSSALVAYTLSAPEECEEILKEMLLYDKGTYNKNGELTKRKNNFHYYYLSSSLGCEFTVTDTYLKEVEEIRRPESRPDFGDTTKIRTETAPQK